MANGHPSFGGTNGVAVLDIGQVGGTRHGAGDAHATIRVTRNPEQVRVAETAYAQENLTHQDVLGFDGGTIVWTVTLRTKDLATQRAILTELDSYRSGATRNSTTGLLNTAVPARVSPTQLTDGDGAVMGGMAVLDRWVTRTRRMKSDTWHIVQIAITFKQMG